MAYKISVVIPVYNGEQFVARCIDSVIAQTYKNWELIIIDDGSEDNTLAMLREYEKRDERIVAYTQKNSGAGTARNLGMKYITGDYLVFIDADDWIESNYFYELSQCKEDVVFIDVNRRTSYKSKVNYEYMSRFSRGTKDDLIRNQMTGRMPWGGWRKAVRAEIIREQSIEYSNHNIGEEAIYSFCLLYYAKSFRFLKKQLYNYEVRPGSLSQTYNDDPWWKVCIELKKKLTELSLYERYADTLNSFMYTATLIALNRVAKHSDVHTYEKKAKTLLNRLESNIDSAYGIDIKHLDIRTVCMIPFFKLPVVIFLVSRI